MLLDDAAVRDRGAMQWDSEEDRQGDQIAQVIEAYSCVRISTARISTCRRSEITLSYASALSLLSTLSCNPCGLIGRQLCKEFGFDQPRALKWRLEHKLIQAIILNRYLPKGAVPETIGAAQWALKEGLRCGLRKRLVDVQASGVVIKRTLGYASGEYGGDLTEETLDYLSAVSKGKTPVRLCQERYVPQTKVAIVREVRVHSIEGREPRI